jgi:hypothetical protein
VTIVPLLPIGSTLITGGSWKITALAGASIILASSISGLSYLIASWLISSSGWRFFGRIGSGY